MSKLYKFEWDCGRMGEIFGIFVAEEDEIKKAIGKEVYFGEVLGKHSEIFGELEEEDFTKLSDDQDFIDNFVKIISMSVGYNPLDYLEDE